MEILTRSEGAACRTNIVAPSCDAMVLAPNLCADDGNAELPVLLVGIVLGGAVAAFPAANVAFAAYPRPRLLQSRPDTCIRGVSRPRLLQSRPDHHVAQSPFSRLWWALARKLFARLVRAVDPSDL